jgi:hypothetical protein
MGDTQLLHRLRAVLRTLIKFTNLHITHVRPQDRRRPTPQSPTTARWEVNRQADVSWAQLDLHSFIIMVVDPAGVSASRPGGLE